MEPPEIAASIARVFVVLRLMLASFSADMDEKADAPAAPPDLTALESAVQALDSTADRYQLLAHLAMLVRWASAETGRSEAEIMAILERKDMNDVG